MIARPDPNHTSEMTKARHLAGLFLWAKDIQCLCTLPMCLALCAGPAAFKASTDPYGLDPFGEPRLVIGFNIHTTYRGRTICRFKPARRHLRDEFADRVFFFHADDGIKVAAHANIGLIGRAIWQDLGISGRHMGVRAQNKRCPPVTMVPKSHLFRRGFGMKIKDHRVNILAQLVLGKQLVSPWNGQESGSINRRPIMLMTQTFLPALVLKT